MISVAESDLHRVWPIMFCLGNEQIYIESEEVNGYSRWRSI